MGFFSNGGGGGGFDGGSGVEEEKCSVPWLALTASVDNAAQVSAAGSNVDRRGPPWLTAFIHSEYFVSCQCPRHSARKYFCVQCKVGVCKAESESQAHRGHPCLQVRKASHENSIKVEDIQPFVNLVDIQFFYINHSHIVFIQARTHQPKMVIAVSHCSVCQRSLMDPSKRFCSLQCKLRAIVEPRCPRDQELTMVNDGRSSCAYNRESTGRLTVNQHLHYVGHSKSPKAASGAAKMARPKKKRNKKMAVVISLVNPVEEVTAGVSEVRLEVKPAVKPAVCCSVSEVATSADRSSPESEVLNAVVNEDDVTSQCEKGSGKRRKNPKPAKSPTF